jgi:hypothetical protein
MKIKCKKDLVNATGHQDFTKNKIYDAISEKYKNDTINEETLVVKDDENMPHRLGEWHKHFKIVK